MSMKNKNIYSNIMLKVNEYNNNHDDLAEKIKMNVKTNQKLISELNDISYSKTGILSIEIIFGLFIKIDNKMYDFEIVVLGKEKKRKKGS